MRILNTRLQGWNASVSIEMTTRVGSSQKFSVVIFLHQSRL